jgi:hypothetical protein
VGGTNQSLLSVKLVFKKSCIKAFYFLGEEIYGKIIGSFSTKQKRGQRAQFRFLGGKMCQNIDLG